MLFVKICLFTCISDLPLCLREALAWPGYIWCTHSHTQDFPRGQVTNLISTCKWTNQTPSYQESLTRLIFSVAAEQSQNYSKSIHVFCSGKSVDLQIEKKRSHKLTLGLALPSCSQSIAYVSLKFIASGKTLVYCLQCYYVKPKETLGQPAWYGG